MQAVFRFNGSEEIVVSTQHTVVLVEHILTRPAGEIEKEICAKASGPGAPYIDEHGWFRDGRPLALSKSAARSLASAMMQAAAEL